MWICWYTVTLIDNFDINWSARICLKSWRVTYLKEEKDTGQYAKVANMQHASFFCVHLISTPNVSINKLHVNIIELAFRGQKYATVWWDIVTVCATGNHYDRLSLVEKPRIHRLLILNRKQMPTHEECRVYFRDNHAVFYLLIYLTSKVT